MSEKTIDRLSRALRDDQSRLDALNALDKVDTIDEKVARELIDDLDYALDTESNAYTILQLLNQLQRITDSHPLIAAEALETIVEFTNESFEGFEGDDPSENLRLSRSTDIIEEILEATEPGNNPLEIRYDDIRSIVEQGETRHRALAYRLLGRTATGGAARILLRDFSHELKQVSSARDEALNEASEIVATSLGNYSYLSQLETIDAFSELYAAGYLSPTADQLEAVRRSVFDLADTVTEDEREQLVSSVSRLVRHDDELANSIVSEAVEILESDSDRDAEMWSVLQACAEGAPDTVASRAETIAKELRSTNHSNRRPGLNVVFTLAKRLSSMPAAFADPVLEFLQDTDRDIVERAINTVSVMGFYPAPDRVLELTDHGSPVVSNAASQAKKRIKENKPDPSFGRELSSGRTRVGLFEDDAGDIFLKKRTETGKWAEISLGALREGIVDTVSERITRDENVPVVYPYYEPRDVVTLVVAMAVQNATDDVQIGFYSPGSQTQWGTKGQIREELRNYGLSDASGEVIYAKPIPEVVPDAYVSNGEVKHNSDGDGPGRIILTKDIPELEQVPELDVVLLNSTARSRLESESDVDALENKHPDANIVSAYSCYTRNDTEGRPRYGPPTGLESAVSVPDQELLEPLVTDGNRTGTAESESGNPASERRIGSTGTNPNHWLIGDDDVRGLSRTSEIEIEHVEDEQLTGLFDQLFEESAKLRDVDDEGASNLIFARQMFFERLPVPAQDYDEWIRDRLYDGDRYVPPLVQERIDDLEHKAGSVERLEAVQPLNTSIKIIERINERLRTENPLFDVLQRHVHEAREEGEKLAIFSESPKNAQLLRETLSKYDILSTEDQDAGDISVVSPNEARKIGPHDKLLLIGAVHPENAGFYVHPRVEKTIIATYDRSWATMIGRQASEFVELLNGAIGGTDYAPFAKPEVVGDLPQQTESDESESVDEEPLIDSEGGERTKAQILEEALRSVSGTTHTEDSGRYERELRHYVVETESGESIQLSNHDTILQQRVTSSGNDYRWVNPDSLSTSDTIVTIPDNVQRDLWRQQLVELYEEEIGSPRVIDDIEAWYDALNSIWNQAEQELDEQDVSSDSDLYNTLHGWIDREVEEFDKTPQTVKTWFESARKAESAIELAEDPSLILGPRSYRDIEAIGLAFSHERLTEDAEEIEKSMEALRTINRREGYDYRDKLEEMISSDGSSRVSQAAVHHKVKGVREGKLQDQEHVEKDQIRERVRDLVRLAPTKNSQLAEEWGYESGSDLYQFLSTEFEGYYERNDDKLIVPTEKAEKLASDS